MAAFTGMDDDEIKLATRAVEIYSLFVKHKNLGMDIGSRELPAGDLERLSILDSKINDIMSKRPKRGR